MAELIAKPALARATARFGDVIISTVHEEQATLIAPFRGREGAVSAALMKAFGLGWPGVGLHIEKSGVRLIWAGRGRALLVGAPSPGLEGLAAVTCQSGAEAVLVIDGDDSESVLARLVPMDLRTGSFGPGKTARTQLGHMSASISRVGPRAFEVRVMRSMAETLWHEVTEAARLLAAR